MYRSRLTLALLLAGTCLSACATDSPVSPGDPGAFDGRPLVNAPSLTPADLVELSSIVQTPKGPPAGAARAQFDDGFEDTGPAQIYEEDTRLVFDPGYAGAYGTHRFIGNMGSITTTVNVTHGSKHLGSQTATRQSYTPFLLDWGQLKHVWVFPKVYSDHDCGLTATAESEHRAWWEFYQGNDVQTWGLAIRTTQARPLSQGACAQGGTGGYESDRPRSGGGIVCTYWITYDIDTGQVLAADLLYCSSTGGTHI